jgi:hypothetical protein
VQQKINGCGREDAAASSLPDLQVKVARNAIHAFNQGERYQLYILEKAGHDQSAIAEVRERSKVDH